MKSDMIVYLMTGYLGTLQGPLEWLNEANAISFTFSLIKIQLLEHDCGHTPITCTSGVGYLT